MKRLLPGLAGLSAVVVLLSSCGDAETPSQADLPPDVPERTLQVVDGDDPEGNAHFFWLRPLGDRRDFPGTADGSLRPVVEICLRNAAGDGCAPGDPLVRYFVDQGDAPDHIRVDDDGHYFIPWRMNATDPETGEIYRIRVLIQESELGWADVIVLHPGDVRAYSSPAGDEVIPVSDRGVLRVAFRIEEGALEAQFCDADGDGDQLDCSVAVDDPNDGESTVVQVEDPASGDVAGVVEAPDGAFVDSDGEVVEGVVIVVESEANPPSPAIPDADELPYFIQVNTFPEDVAVDPDGPGVKVVVCQDFAFLDGLGIGNALASEMVLYKVSDDGTETVRLATTFGAPECTPGSHGASLGDVDGPAGLFRYAAARLGTLLGPRPLVATVLHGGLNTTITSESTLDSPFSTFGATLGPNAAQTTAVVPGGVLDEPTTIETQVRNGLGGNFVFGGDTLSVEVTDGPNAGAIVTVTDNEDGTYTATYTPTSSGVDEITILLTTADATYVNAPIGGSPYTSVIGTAGGADPFADAVLVNGVVDNEQLFQDPTAALGPYQALDQTGTPLVELGPGGFIVLDMGAGEAIVDGPGADFMVVESDGGRIGSGFGFAESYEVEVASAPAGPWTSLGVVSGTALLDLDGSGVSVARYLRITDVQIPAGTDGADIQGIAAFHYEAGDVEIQPGVVPREPGPDLVVEFTSGSILSSAIIRQAATTDETAPDGTFATDTIAGVFGSPNVASFDRDDFLAAAPANGVVVVAFEIEGGAGSPTWAFGTVEVTPPSTEVINSDDSGPGSLRQAILNANATPGPDTVTFAIPGAGPHVINVGSDLPAVTEAVTIDGATQPGWTASTPQVQIHGADATGHGLEIAAAGVSVRGLSVTGFPGNGVFVHNGVTGLLLDAAFVGVAPDGVTAAPNALSGVHLNYADLATITGSVVSGNGENGILVVGGSDHVIEANWIGMSRDGATLLSNQWSGVTLYDGATDVVIRENLITGNLQWGVDIQHSGALAQVTGTQIVGNTIGLDGAGNVIGHPGSDSYDNGVIDRGPVDRGNLAGGVRVRNAPNTSIGVPGNGNVISGNGNGAGGSGIRTEGTVSPAATIRDNLVGTDQSALLERGNRDGIIAEGLGTVIGGPAAGDGNVISGNISEGIEVGGLGEALVEGNYLGVGGDGQTPLGNGRYTGPNDPGCCHTGIFVRAPGTTVRGNLVGDNDIGGIRVGDQPSSGNVVEGNWVGTDPGGTLSVGNGGGNGYGIGLFGDAGGTVVRGNLVRNQAGTGIILVEGSYLALVGGSTPADANVVSGNGIGIAVGYNTAATDSLNTIRGNRIFANAGLGIDLASDGITVNDPLDADTGPNGLLNRPTVNFAWNDSPLAPGQTRIGILIDGLPETVFDLEVFANATCDLSGSGEGEVPVQYFPGVATTDVDGLVAFEVRVDERAEGEWITATLTDPLGNTSEFSVCEEVVAPE